MYICNSVSNLFKSSSLQMSEVEQADFPCQKNHPRRRKNSWSSPAPNGTKGAPPLATGIHSSLSRSADLISRGSHERLQFGISFWLGRTSGLARVDGQYVLYMSAPALDVRRHISNLGRPATVFKVCKGRWWFR